MKPAPGSAAATWSPAARRVTHAACGLGLAGATLRADADNTAAPLVTTLHITGVVVVLMALVLGLVVAGVLLWRAARQVRHHADELHRVRERLQCLDDLVDRIDVWQWRTNPTHQLVWLRPPHSADGAGCSPVAGTVLWAYFKVTDETALRARLEHHAALDAVTVSVEHDEPGTLGDHPPGRLPPATRFQLHGRIRTDASGRFNGYQGVLHAPHDPAVDKAQPAVVALAAAEPAAFESDHAAFSFTVSHDLRAPIRVVEGFTKIIKEDYGRLLDRVGNEHLDRVLSAAARMNNMIDALLALARLASQPLAQQPVDLSALATYVADDLRREWPERQVRLDIAPAMRVQGDPTLLRVVLENLLGNAWKYSARSAEPHISFGPQDGAVDVFTVRDNGAGFDMRFADRLFGVFQRLHSATDFPGSGIGLASVRRIVRRHGGDVWGEGEVGQGASFHFSLPQRPPRT